MRSIKQIMASLNFGLQNELSHKGLSFNDVQPSTFRQLLSKAGFHKEWKNRYGRKARSKLESTVGELGKEWLAEPHTHVR
jgi:TRAP-type transport system periplasmic protein